MRTRWIQALALAGVALGAGLGLAHAARAASSEVDGLYLEVRNGQRVKPYDDAGVYLVDRGVLRHLTYETYTRLFDGWGGICTINELPATVLGEKLTDHTRLVKTSKKTTVWLIDNGRVRRAFDSPKFFGANGFAWSKVQLVSESELEEYPIGDTIRWIDSRL